MPQPENNMPQLMSQESTGIAQSFSLFLDAGSMEACQNPQISFWPITQWPRLNAMWIPKGTPMPRVAKAAKPNRIAPAKGPNRERDRDMPPARCSSPETFERARSTSA